MADNAKLMADIATLSEKVDTLIAKANQPAQPPVDDQPLIDQADAAVGAIIAKIPS